MQLTQYNQSFLSEIIEFNKRIFPVRKGVEESFDFRFFNNPVGNSLSKSYFIKDENEVLGQFLLQATEFHFKGKKYTGNWGIDFILDEKLRGLKKGKILAEAAMNYPNYCAMGPSVVSESLHLKFGNIEHAKAWRFIRPTGVSSISSVLFSNAKFDRKKVKFPSEIYSNHIKANRILDQNNLPNLPYWNENFLEWDRSKTFLKWRFFSEENKFSFYFAEDSSFYFVVRKIRWKKVNSLLLVDFRYKNEENFRDLYKMALKVAKKTKSVFLLTLSSEIKEIETLKKNFNKTFGNPMQIMTTCKEVVSAKHVQVTAADSDFDTFYGDNVW